MFTHFSNPLFIIGMVSSLLNPTIAIIILIFHYLPNIIIGILFRSYFNSDKENEIIETKHQNFGICLASSIQNAMNTLLLVFGTITFFLIISTLLNQIFNFSPILRCCINGILEMTQGIKFASMLSISNKWKGILIGTFLSFGGISVHTQIISIISDTKIKYRPFLMSRIIHSFLTFILLWIFL
jgi:hypothetical protein